MPVGELAAVQHAIQKLEAEGDHLRFPHSSQVQGAARIRELRPRAGRSRWRAFYRRIANIMVIGSIGPDAKVDKAAFEAAVVSAEERLDQIAQETDSHG